MRNGLAALQLASAGRESALAIESLHDLALVIVDDPAGYDKAALAAAVLHAAERARVSVIDVVQSSGRAAIAVVVRRDDRAHLSRELSAHVCVSLRIETLEPVASLSLRGDVMAGRPGYAGRVFAALGLANVPILAVVQGPAEKSIACYVRATDHDRGERALRDAFAQDVAVNENREG